MKAEYKKLSYYFLSAFLILSILIGICMPYSKTVLAAESPSSEENSFIYDKAKKLTKDEIVQLNEEIAAASARSGIDFYILTTQDLKNKSLMQYMEDFADKHAFTDTAFLCISFEQPRGFEIQGYGTAQHYLTYDRINSIFDVMQNDLSNGNYYTACSTFISKAANYMLTELAEDESPNEDTIYDDDYQSAINYNTNNLLITFPMQILISFVAALILVLFLIFDAGGKVTTTSSTYLDETHSRLLAKRDRYVRTSVTKHKIKKSSSSQHHGGRGTSSHGRSHSGGGGRHF